MKLNSYLTPRHDSLEVIDCLPRFLRKWERRPEKAILRHNKPVALCPVHEADVVDISYQLCHRSRHKRKPFYWRVVGRYWLFTALTLHPTRDEGLALTETFRSQVQLGVVPYCVKIYWTSVCVLTLQPVMSCFSTLMLSVKTSPKLLHPSGHTMCVLLEV